jgi:hypothetical protein
MKRLYWFSMNFKKGATTILIMVIVLYGLSSCCKTSQIVAVCNRDAIRSFRNEDIYLLSFSEKSKSLLGNFAN